MLKNKVDTSKVDMNDVDAKEKTKIFEALKKERAEHAVTKTELKTAIEKLTQIATLGQNPNAEAIAAHVDAMTKAEVAKHGAQSIQRITALETELNATKDKLS